MKIKYLRFTTVFIVFLSCTQKKTKTTESVSVPSEDKELAEKRISAEDSAFVKSIFQELKGIEKFALKEDFDLLLSLLAFKGDSINHSKVKAILEKKPYYNTYFYDVVDMKNGYIRYMKIGAEAAYQVTYWNLNDNSKLIATELWTCGPVCSSYLSFEKYQNGIYESLENQEIIPEIERLPSLLLPDYKPEYEPYEFKYKLPQGGKNIQFCLDEKCIELEWQNGIFKFNEQ